MRKQEIESLKKIIKEIETSESPGTVSKDKKIIELAKKNRNLSLNIESLKTKLRFNRLASASKELIDLKNSQHNKENENDSIKQNNEININAKQIENDAVKITQLEQQVQKVLIKRQRKGSMN